MKKCINCGAELLDEAAFCSHCGTACEEDMATQPLEEDEATALLEEKDLLQTNAATPDAGDEATTLLDEEMLENSSPDMEENTTVLEEKSSKPSAETGKKVGMDEIQRNIEKKTEYRNGLDTAKHSRSKAQSTVSSQEEKEGHDKKQTALDEQPADRLSKTATAILYLAFVPVAVEIIFFILWRIGGAGTFPITFTIELIYIIFAACYYLFYVNSLKKHKKFTASYVFYIGTWVLLIVRMVIQIVLSIYMPDSYYYGTFTLTLDIVTVASLICGGVGLSKKYHPSGEKLMLASVIVLSLEQLFSLL